MNELMGIFEVMKDKRRLIDLTKIQISLYSFSLLELEVLVLTWLRPIRLSSMTQIGTLRMIYRPKLELIVLDRSRE